MRELVLAEVNYVSGGNKALLGALVGGAIIVGLVGSYLTSPYKVKYEPYEHTYEVITPVYDANGVYAGDMVDTYTEIKYKPVYY